ncbi:glycosyltransferase family 4 protein [Pilimelia columellifera]
MLVDNAVNGDSRVQKLARSAAELGWDVTLLGRSPTAEPQTWKLGEAKVRLLPMPRLMSKRRHEYRRAMLRWPLAYPPTGIPTQRAAAVRAWRADIDLRVKLLDIAQRSGKESAADQRWRRRWLYLERVACGVRRRWTSARRRMLTLARGRRQLTSPWDRLYTWFWLTVSKERAWRKLEPSLWDYEFAYGPVIDELAPDLIHANDFRMLGVGARAKIRALAGRQHRTELVWDAHEFLPGIKPWAANARWKPGHLAHEREYAPYADAVMTVSPALSELLRDAYRLPEMPSVVLNAPAVDHDPEPHVGVLTASLRQQCGISSETPLMVYSGVAAEQRGLATMVEAMPQLDGVHVALVVNHPDGKLVADLVDRARTLGVADRLHPLPYVPHWQVVGFLSGADVGVIPIHHWPNHEIALITKFFEYSHARLPLVVSDVKTMAETVRATGQGEVFRAKDVADFVRAVRAILADPRRYRAAYDTPGLLEGWTWEAQVRVLDEVYSRLCPPGVPAADDATVADHFPVAANHTIGDVAVRPRG